MFDFNKVEDFDKHISLSIPNYDQLFNTFKNIASIYSEPDSCVIDYGCSTGKFLLQLPKKKGCRYYGIDESSLIPPTTSSIHFFKEDAILFGEEINQRLEIDIPSNFLNQPSVVVCMFFLQFLTKSERKKMLSVLKSQIDGGAVLLISEKIMLSDIKIDNIISRLHIEEKRKNFTDTEILDKDRQILDSMYILEETELLKELNSIGNATKVWQSYNFCGYVVKK